ncbi:hypothetical protein TWF730_010211 [Orbilia blumenaviensis]|uniref:Uncharacterized protein n=1 Tax=Orbilia blumenaviensis TaxID=1796055 RepID=A0AAV9UP57_9PEZI
MKDPLPPQPPPTPLELDTTSIIDLSEISPSAFSPTSEGTSADGLLTASLLPTLSNTFVFPDPTDAASMGRSVSVCSRETSREKYGRGYRGYAWETPSLSRPLREELCSSSVKSDKEYYCHGCHGSVQVDAPIQGFNPGLISESKILNFFITPSKIPHTQPTSTDLFLGSVYTASVLRLLFQLVSTTVFPAIAPVLATEVTVIIAIICLTSLTAWFVSAGRDMKDGWAVWGCLVTVRFITSLAGVYALMEVGLFTTTMITSFFQPSEPEDLDNILITVPGNLEKRHILDLITKFQVHLNSYIPTIERDMISYVNAKIQTGEADGNVMEHLEKVYAGLVSLGQLEISVLGEVLRGLWGGF